MVLLAYLCPVILASPMYRNPQTGSQGSDMSDSSEYSWFEELNDSEHSADRFDSPSRVRPLTPFRLATPPSLAVSRQSRPGNYATTESLVSMLEGLQIPDLSLASQIDEDRLPKYRKPIAVHAQKKPTPASSIVPSPQFTGPATAALDSGLLMLPDGNKRPRLPVAQDSKMPPAKKQK